MTKLTSWPVGGVALLFVAVHQFKMTSCVWFMVVAIRSCMLGVF